MKSFVIYCMSILPVFFFFLMPSNFVIAAMGNEIHSISFNRQILEEIGLISCLSLWLHKEEKNEKNQCLKT